MTKKSFHTAFIKQQAEKDGFNFCGISKAEKLNDEARLLEKWLHQNKHGNMHYMENYFDKRIDPTLLMPGAKSVISLMYNYYPDQKQNIHAKYKISKYAYGEDYHIIIKNKLAKLLNILIKEIGTFHARIFTDSAPVLEKAWAKKSGLGWQGKNTNIINPKAGSFFFLAEIICDIDLEYDHAIKDYCGTCNACVQACPTDALHEPYAIDASKCISYFTIELKDNALPTDMKHKFNNWIFGCDICQDVCPWNRFSKPHTESAFSISPQLQNITENNWHDLTEELFDMLFKNSAIQRTKYAGLKRNIQFISTQ